MGLGDPIRATLGGVPTACEAQCCDRSNRESAVHVGTWLIEHQDASVRLVLAEDPRNGSPEREAASDEGCRRRAGVLRVTANLQRAGTYPFASISTKFREPCRSRNFGGGVRARDGRHHESTVPAISHELPAPSSRFPIFRRNGAPDTKARSPHGVPHFHLHE